jgi:hypothetical protein
MKPERSDATRRLEPPGFLALHSGNRTPAVLLVAYAAYGGRFDALAHGTSAQLWVNTHRGTIAAMALGALAWFGVARARSTRVAPGLRARRHP